MFVFEFVFWDRWLDKFMREIAVSVLPKCAINIFYRRHLHLHFEIIELSECKVARGRPGGGHLKGHRQENAPQHNSFHESLPSPPVKTDVLKHLFFESPQPPLSHQRLPSMTQVFRLACTASPAGECLCPFSSCHSIYMASDPQL